MITNKRRFIHITKGYSMTMFSNLMSDLMCEVVCTVMKGLVSSVHKYDLDSMTASDQH